MEGSLSVFVALVASVLGFIGVTSSVLSGDIAFVVWACICCTTVWDRRNKRNDLHQKTTLDNEKDEIITSLKEELHHTKIAMQSQSEMQSQTLDSPRSIEGQLQIHKELMEVKMAVHARDSEEARRREEDRRREEERRRQEEYRREEERRRAEVNLAKQVLMDQIKDLKAVEEARNAKALEEDRNRMVAERAAAEEHKKALELVKKAEQDKLKVEREAKNRREEARKREEETKQKKEVERKRRQEEMEKQEEAERKQMLHKEIHREVEPVTIKQTLIEGVLQMMKQEANDKTTDMIRMNGEIKTVEKEMNEATKEHSTHVDTCLQIIDQNGTQAISATQAIGEYKAFSVRSHQRLEMLYQLAKQLAIDFAITPEGSLARQVYFSSTKIESIEGLDIHKLPVEQTYSNPRDKYRHYQLGKPTPNKANKVIMMAGITGAGKSLMTNNIINYIFGVSLRDNFRFKLVCDEEEFKERGDGNKSKAESMTTWISCYTLHHQEGFRIPFSLTIIDTPGFGDTRGVQHDQYVVNSLRKFFEDQQYPVDELAGIGLVIQASQARLTAEQLYVFNQVLDIFGNDIKENISLMFTFADAQPPPALEVIEAEKIPHNPEGKFKFNNSAVYAGKEGKNAKATKFSWDFGFDSLKNFFHHVGSITPTSLNLTKEVLKERDHLHQYLDILRKRINDGMSMLKAIESMTADIMRIKGTMEANKNFKVKSTRHPQETQIVDHHITNCVVCMYTCHDPCRIKGDDKTRCASMRSGRCVACPGMCSSDSHKNGDRIYIYKTIEVEETVSDMLQRFQIASTDKNGKLKLLEALLTEYTAYKQMVFDNIQSACGAAARLEEIGLGRSVLNSVKYIEQLISAEEKSDRPNKENRLTQLNHFREKAKLLQTSLDNPDEVHFLSSYETTVYDAIEQLKEESIKREKYEYRGHKKGGGKGKVWHVPNWFNRMGVSFFP